MRRRQGGEPLPGSRRRRKRRQGGGGWRARLGGFDGLGGFDDLSGEWRCGRDSDCRRVIGIPPRDVHSCNHEEPGDKLLTCKKMVERRR